MQVVQEDEKKEPEIEHVPALWIHGRLVPLPPSVAAASVNDQ